MAKKNAKNHTDFIGILRMPCRWHGKSIIVLDMIQIDDPYTPEACTAPKAQANALARVKKVVRTENSVYSFFYHVDEN